MTKAQLAQMLAKSGQKAGSFQEVNPSLVRANVGREGVGFARPGDKPTELSLTTVVPSDLIIVMDNTEGDVPVIYMLGNAIPNHLRQFQNPNNYDVSGDWTNPDNFINGNDELIRLYLLNCGLKIKALDRQVNVSVDQFQQPVTALRGMYNSVVPKSITTQLNHFSSTDYDRKINNVVLKDSSLDLTFYNTYFFQVGAGEKLTMTFRIKEGINWPFEA